MNAFGRPLAVILTPGQAGGDPQLLPLLDALADLPAHGRTVHVERVIADEAHAHRPARQALRRQRITATIPGRSDQIARREAKGSAGGRPPAFDGGIHRQCNVVERCINRSKQFRASATRYAERAAYFRSEVIVACTVLHLR